MATDYLKVLYGDHGAYTEHSEKQMALENFDFHHEGTYYDLIKSTGSGVKVYRYDGKCIVVFIFSIHTKIKIKKVSCSFKKSFYMGNSCVRERTFPFSKQANQQKQIPNFFHQARGS